MLPIATLSVFKQTAYVSSADNTFLIISRLFSTEECTGHPAIGPTAGSLAYSYRLSASVSSQGLNINLSVSIIATSKNSDLSLCQPILLAPDAELIEHLHQRLSTLGERILHLRRDLRILGADDQFICLQLLEIRAEGLVGNGFQIPLQLVESHRLKLHQAVKNDHLVLAGDQRQRVGKAGVLKIGVLNIVL